MLWRAVDLSFRGSRHRFCQMGATASHFHHGIGSALSIHSILEIMRMLEGIADNLVHRSHIVVLEIRELFGHLRRCKLFWLFQTPSFNVLLEFFITVEGRKGRHGCLSSLGAQIQCQTSSLPWSMDQFTADNEAL